MSIKEPLTSLAKSEGPRRIQFKLFQYSYLNEAILNEQPTDVTAMGLALKDKGQVLGLDYKMDFQGLFAQQESDRPYLTVPDLYLAHQSSIGNLSLGRKKRVWSKFDELWKLGIWQPQARWDYIHPQTQGLTGLFWEKQVSQGFELSAFATPIFLPDQGPNFELVDGQFTSQNRWFWGPQVDVELLDSDAEIRYSLDRPNETDVILNGGGALQARMWSESTGLWVSAAHAFKPINQIHLGGEPRLRTQNILNETVVDVEISTEVAYHQLSTLEGGWKSPDVQTSFSVTRDAPIKPEMPDERVKSSLVETYFTGVQLEHRLKLGSFRNGRVRYAYMKTFFGERVNGGNGFTSNLDSSLSRFNFEDVAMFEIGQPFFASTGSPVTLGMKYFYSFPEDGQLLSGQLLWQVNRQLSWVALIDVLSAREASNEVGSGLMSRFRSNDRVALGATYVF
ncbi:MAG: hypothetical protein AAF202_00885 [Pseudomonadota bacterium]